MDYKEFKRLYDGDRIVFMLAMELFLENGRKTVAEHNRAALVQAVTEKLSNFLIPEKACEVVQVARAFSQLKTGEFLSYASKCGIQLESEDEDISGICPVCGGPLLYGEDASADSDGEVGWTCQDCGATGKEAYRQVFDCHRDVRLGDGRPVPPKE